MEIRNTVYVTHEIQLCHAKSTSKLARPKSYNIHQFMPITCIFRPSFFTSHTIKNNNLEHTFKFQISNRDRQQETIPIFPQAFCCYVNNSTIQQFYHGDSCCNIESTTSPLFMCSLLSFLSTIVTSIVENWIRTDDGCVARRSSVVSEGGKSI